MRDKHKCYSELPSIPAIPSHQHQPHTHSQHAVNGQDLLNAPGSEWLGAWALPVSFHPGENLLVLWLQPNSTSWFSTKRSISIDKEQLTVLRPNGLPLLPLPQWEWEYWHVKMYPLAKITPHKVKNRDKVSLVKKSTDNINPGKRGYSDLAFVSGNKPR